MGCGGGGGGGGSYCSSWMGISSTRSSTAVVVCSPFRGHLGNSSTSNGGVLSSTIAFLAGTVFCVRARERSRARRRLSLRQRRQRPAIALHQRTGTANQTGTRDRE